MTIKRFLKRFIQEEEGATAVEYAIMVALIAAVIITAVGLLGRETNSTFSSVANAVSISGTASGN